MSSSGEESDAGPRCKRKRKSRQIEDSPASTSSGSPIIGGGSRISMVRRRREQVIDSSDSDSGSSIIIHSHRRRKVAKVVSDSDDDTSDSEFIRRTGKPRRLPSDSENESFGGTSSSQWETDFENDSQKNANSSIPAAVQDDANDSDSSNGTSEKCPICLLSFKTQELATPGGCDHMFCLECLQEWSKNMNTCPVDRQEYNVIQVRKNLEGEIVRYIHVDIPAPQNFINIIEDPTFCEICGSSDNEDQMLLCDGCDLGFHLYCLDPPLDSVPEGAWYCRYCAPGFNFVSFLLMFTTNDSTRRSSRRSHRSIPRTRQSERVRRRIANNRQQNTQTSDTTDSPSASAVPQESVSSSTVTRAKKKKHKKSKKKSRSEVRYRTVYEIDEGTGLTIAVQKREVRRRKNRRKVRQVPKTSKSRLARHLGIGVPGSASHQDSSLGGGECQSNSIEGLRYSAGIPTLHLFGRNDQLDYFSDADEEYETGSQLMTRRAPNHSDVVAMRRATRRKAIIDAPVVSSSTDLLDSILNSQEQMLSRNASYSVDPEGRFKVETQKKLEKENYVDLKKEQASVKETPNGYNNRRYSGYNRYRNSYSGGGNYNYNNRRGQNYNSYGSGSNNGRASYGGQPSSSFNNSFNRYGGGRDDYDVPQDYTQRTLCASSDVEPPERKDEHNTESELDIYSDIETVSTSRAEEPDYHKPLSPPPAVPNILMGDDEENDSEPDMVIDIEKVNEEQREETAVTSTVGYMPDFSRPPPLLPPPPLPMSAEIQSEAVQSSQEPDFTADDDLDGCPNANIYSQQSYNPFNDTQEDVDDEEDEGCPNFSIYSRESKSMALHTDLSISAHQVSEISSSPQVEGPKNIDNVQAPSQDAYDPAVPTFDEADENESSVAHNEDLYDPEQIKSPSIPDAAPNEESSLPLPTDVPLPEDDQHKQGNALYNTEHESEDNEEANQSEDEDKSEKHLNKGMGEVSIDCNTSMNQNEGSTAIDDENHESLTKHDRSIEEQLQEMEENAEPDNLDKTSTDNVSDEVNESQEGYQDSKLNKTPDEAKVTPERDCKDGDQLKEKDTPEHGKEGQDKAVTPKQSKIIVSKVEVIKPPKEGGILGGLYSDSEDESVVKNIAFGTANEGRLTEDISEEERSYTPCLDEKSQKRGIEGLDTEMISDEDRNDFDESHEKTGDDGDALEINVKDSEMDLRPEDYEEGEIVDKEKAEKEKEKEAAEAEEAELKKEKPKKEEAKDSKKKKKEKDKNKEKEKSKDDNKENEKGPFKKLSKNSKGRNYRDKDKSKERDKEESKEKEREKEQMKEKKKKEKRKEIERYDVRALVADKPQRDQFGRDIPSRSRSSSHTPPLRLRRSRTPSLPRRRSHSPRRRSMSPHRRSSSLPRRRSLPPHRRSITPRRRRSRSRSLSKDRRKRRKRAHSSPSRSRSRSRSRHRSKKRTASEKRHSGGGGGSGKKRKRSRSVSRHKESRGKGGKKKQRKNRGRSRSRSKSHASHHHVHEYSHRERQWTPTFSVDLSPTAEAPMSPSWTPPRLLEEANMRNQNLAVTLNNHGAAGKKKKDKRKKDKRNKETGRRRGRRYERERTPPPSKEVFASGDNILVSVSFNNENERDVTTRDKRREDGQKKKKKKNKNKRDLTGVKPVAIIDLARSPFRELTPSPKNVIVLTDSDNDETQNANNVEKSICDSSQQVTSPERSTFTTGPKTPPEPQIKFTLSAKPPQMRQISNPLREPDEMEPMMNDDDEDIHEELENRLEQGLHKGPNTPPEPPNSPPSSPDAYDPFEPTKSRSPTPEPIPHQSSAANPEESLAEANLENHIIEVDLTGTSNGQPQSQEPAKSLTPPLLDIQPADSQSSVLQVMTPESTVGGKSPERLNSGAGGIQSVQTASGQQPTKPTAQSTPFSTVPTSSSTASSNLAASRVQILNSTVIPAPTVASSIPQRIVLPNQVRSSPVKIPPTKAAVKSTPIKPMPNKKPASAAITNTSTATTSKKKQMQQNLSSSLEDITLDFDSPYSPGSSDYEDLFEPPSDIVTKPVIKGKSSGNKSQKHMSVFDALFGSSPTYKPSKVSKSKYKKNSSATKTKTVGVKLDEDCLKILDELPNSAVEMQVKDKFLKKLNRQERVVEEVKFVLKPYYNKKKITKEEYKDIMRKAVPKICHSKSGEINPSKIKNLIEAYVKKVRHSKKVTSSSSVNPQQQQQQKV